MGKIPGVNHLHAIIPSVYRDDYLTGLRVLTRQGHANPLIEVLDFAQKYTAAIAFPNYDRVLATLRATNAMETPQLDLELQVPSHSCAVGSAIRTCAHVHSSAAASLL